jgi:sarcosine oxidase
VVGAGVFGVSAAIELKHRGGPVTLLDPGPVPRDVAASTDITKAVRMDYGRDELYMRMAEDSLEGWDRWNARWGEPLYHEDGFLFLSSVPMEPGGFEHDSFVLLRKRGHRPERLDAAAIAARHPDWAPGRYVDGYFNPRAGWAESGRVVERLAAEARSAGVEIVEGTGFARLLDEGSRVRGVETSDGRAIEADVVIVAAGAWTPFLLPHLVDVMEVVGQPVLHFGPSDPARFRPPRFRPFAADLQAKGWYGFPATRAGIVKIAHHGRGIPIHPDAPRVVGPEHEPRFRAFLNDAIPPLADAPLVGSRLCLYCDTWDGNFWIDHDPDREGLVVASGGSGHGFKFAPVLGAVIADVVERRENPYAPRFAWRARGAISTEHARHTAS